MDGFRACNMYYYKHKMYKVLESTFCSYIWTYLSIMHIPYNVGSGRLYSSEEEEQTQRESNTQVEVDKVVKSFDQVFSVEMFCNSKIHVKDQ